MELFEAFTKHERPHIQTSIIHTVTYMQGTGLKQGDTVGGQLLASCLVYNLSVGVDNIKFNSE